MGVYSVNTCKIIQVMVAYWYQGYWGVNSSGEGVSIYRGGKNRKKRVFAALKILKILKKWKTRGNRGAENLENFETIEKRGVLRRRNIRKFRKNWKKRVWKFRKFRKNWEKGGSGRRLSRKFRKKIGKRGVFAAPKFSKISKNLASTKSAFWPIEQHIRGRG